MNLRQRSLIAALPWLVLSCSDSQQSTDSVRGWRFKLTLSPGAEIVDSNQTSAEQLHRQVSRLLIQKIQFNDPVLSSRHRGLFQPSVTGQIQIAGKSSQPQTFLWEPNPVNTLGWQFAGCAIGNPQMPDAYVPCEFKNLLQCLSERTSALAGSGKSESLSGENSISTPQRSILLVLLRQCGVTGEFKEPQQQFAFTKTEKEISFSPSPLFSVVVYRGAWASYEDALLEIPAATLPVVVPCSRADGACLESPVEITRCSGCSALEKGQLFTVFFLEGLRQDYSSVRSVVYIP